MAQRFSGGSSDRLRLPVSASACVLGFLLVLPSIACDVDGLIAAVKQRVAGQGASVTSQDGSLGQGNSLGPEAARRLYYQFVDERGSVRFVERLDDVPPQWRATVGFVEMDGPPPISPADAQRRRAARYAARGSGLQAERSRGANTPRDVVMYSADWCGWCKKAKAYLDDKRVPYRERDVDNPAVMAELVEKTGQRGIPVFDVDGRIMTGFDPAGLDQLLRDSA